MCLSLIVGVLVMTVGVFILAGVDKPPSTLAFIAGGVPIGFSLGYFRRAYFTMQGGSTSSWWIPR